MKVRKGFVSNSSSSSFVIALPKEPESMEETYEMLFGEEYDEEEAQTVLTKHVDYQDEVHTLTAKEVADIFYKDIVFEKKENDWNPEEGWTDEDAYEDADEWLIKELEDLTPLERRVTDEFVNRYSYFPDRSYDPFPEFYGTDKKLLEKVKELDAKVWERGQSIEERMKYSNKKYKVAAQLAIKDAKAFLKANKDKFIFFTSYADDGGFQMSYMEHGGVFNNLPHVQISHH